jgi:hypothetical protein
LADAPQFVLVRNEFRSNSGPGVGRIRSRTIRNEGLSPKETFIRMIDRRFLPFPGSVTEQEKDRILSDKYLN